MPRILPWAKNAAHKTPKASTRTDSPRKRVHADADIEDDHASRVKRVRKKEDESPSTKCPEVKPMIEASPSNPGDDAFRMVEDEFYSIAGRFTSHIHAAAYQRLLEEAKTRNANTINSIARPGIGLAGVSSRHYTDAAGRIGSQAASSRSLNGQQQAKIKREEEASDDTISDMPFMKTSLMGLMTSPRKANTDLSSIVYSSPHRIAKVDGPVRREMKHDKAASDSTSGYASSIEDSSPLAAQMTQLEDCPAQSNDDKHRLRAQAASKQITLPAAEYSLSKKTTSAAPATGLRKQNKSTDSKKEHETSALSLVTDDDPFGFASRNSSALSMRLQRARMKREQQVKEQ